MFSPPEANNEINIKKQKAVARKYRLSANNNSEFDLLKYLYRKITVLVSTLGWRSQLMQRNLRNNNITSWKYEINEILNVLRET